MPAPLTLGIDVGTSSAKAVVADAQGTLFVSASRSYRYKSSAPGYAEQDPEDWWQAVREVVQELFAKHPEIRERLC
ncbi:MAG TPA: FGGY family carbohydrate kinase, partial [Bryobacteraceae bacterium]|nr:FGGY family carbohydrate kinase [Bryobacteraceae bacterium]